MTKETRIEWLTLVSDFASLCLCQQWLYLACIVLWLRLNMHQYKNWNACFVANFLCYKIAKYFSDRSTTHRVIAKIKRVPVFKTQCSISNALDTLCLILCRREYEFFVSVFCSIFVHVCLSFVSSDAYAVLLCCREGEFDEYFEDMFL